MAVSKNLENKIFEIYADRGLNSTKKSSVKTRLKMGDLSLIKSLYCK